jgi:hypothetical protein
MQQLFLSLTLLSVIFLTACDDGTRLPPRTLNCSQDTMQCPDGSILSRDPNNACEFPACPGTSANDQQSNACGATEGCKPDFSAAI